MACHSDQCAHTEGHASSADAHPHLFRKIMGVGLAVIGCAACPACLSVYSVLLGALGIGLVVGQAAHVALTIVSVSFVMFLAARRFRRGRPGPLFVALGGAAILLSAHVFGDKIVLEVGGTVGLLTSYLWALSSRPIQARSA